MLFSTNIFVFYFLPIVLFLYLLVSMITQRCDSGGIGLKNTLLLLTSLSFYYWGSGKLIILLLVVVGVNYLCALLMQYFSRRVSAVKALYVIAIAANLGVLVYFKYGYFFYGELLTSLNKYGYQLPLIHVIALPIGISFYIFQSLSYTMDVYRGDVPVQRNFFKLLLYVSFFPQLIAGPIVRYRTVKDEIDSRKSTLDDIYEGFCRFALGLTKKVVFADAFGEVTDQILASEITRLDTFTAWIGLVLYTLRIYFDFSGYSDMAIGLARVFGFHFDENFRSPYTSQNVTAFWRRWHISLSTWFRDYLYIPLGGSHKGSFRTYRNLIIVFLLCGLWHGASYMFLAWGFFHGVFLVIERIVKSRWHLEPAGWLGRLYTIFVVALGWVLFMSPNIVFAWAYFQRLFITQPTEFVFYPVEYYVTRRILFLMIVGISLSCFKLKESRVGTLLSPLRGFACVVCLALSIIVMSKASFSPFIYFQF